MLVKEGFHRHELEADNRTDDCQQSEKIAQLEILYHLLSFILKAFSLSLNSLNSLRCFAFPKLPPVASLNLTGPSKVEPIMPNLSARNVIEPMLANIKSIGPVIWLRTS